MATVVQLTDRNHRVTGWPASARPVNLGARLTAGPIRMPGAHALTKVLGATVSISWGVSNSGGEVGSVRLWLYALGQGGLVVETALVAVQPAGSATLSLSWASTLPSGTHSMLLIMADQSPGAVNSVAEHQFSITVAANGPILAAGTLSIT